MERCRGGLVIAALVALGAGCREAPGPFRLSESRPAPERLHRLTYFGGREHNPSWSPAGDSIYYAAPDLEGLAGPDVLYAIPAVGGGATPLMEDLQGSAASNRVRLVSPAVSPSGDRLAFVEIARTRAEALCGELGRSCDPEGATGLSPILAELRVRVRARGARGPLGETSQSHAVDVESAVVQVVPSTTPRHFRVRVEPYEQLFTRDGARPFRATWSPDGEAVAFASREALAIWTLADGGVRALPGTAPAAWPAWSPDGEWIAFTWLEPADSTGYFCRHFGFLGDACTQERLEILIGQRRLRLVRADGLEVRDFGAGEEPAWSPDGRWLYFRRSGILWRTRVSDGEEQALEGTEGGREPAVSPDGTRLAFIRAQEGGEYDLWVLELPPEP